ncbi:hypothetical protein AB0F18_10815 [Streptomyces sp. NPDC029216]|uniref:hypothetical protein n=1 Tax=Streptomyces sp. NPDC029216 TaxID=3154701 RepID=UPI0033CD5B28
MTTNFGLLVSAAAKWESMAGELQKVESRYGETVQTITMGDNWSGVSAGVARTKFTATRYEYAAAQKQAKAIASLLRGAHEQLTDLKAKLESARDDAVAAGMTVSGEGRVAFDHARLTPAERSAYLYGGARATAVSPGRGDGDGTRGCVGSADTGFRQPGGGDPPPRALTATSAQHEEVLGDFEDFVRTVRARTGAEG